MPIKSSEPYSPLQNWRLITVSRLAKQYHHHPQLCLMYQKMYLNVYSDQHRIGHNLITYIIVLTPVEGDCLTERDSTIITLYEQLPSPNVGQTGATLRPKDLASLTGSICCFIALSQHASPSVKETQKKLVHVTKALSDTFSNQF